MFVACVCAVDDAVTAHVEVDAGAAGVTSELSRVAFVVYNNAKRSGGTINSGAIECGQLIRSCHIL